MSKGDVHFPNSEPLTTKSTPSLPLSSPGWNLVKTFKSFRLLEDEEGHAYAIPVIITDPQQTSMVPMGVYLGTSVNKSASNPGNGPWVFNVPELLKAVTALYEQQRTPDTFKQLALTAASGQAGIWEPAAGKKFRLMGGVITIAKGSTAAGAISIGLQDGAAGAQVVFIALSGAALLATPDVNCIPFTIPFNGYLSTTADNWLYLNNSAAFTAGGVSVAVWGTEE